MRAPAHPREAERLAALHRYEILDTDAEIPFDRITRIAARLFDVPVALVTLVDEHRQWFKSCIGVKFRETHRDDSFCAHAILAPGPLVVADAREDPRFSDNALVRGDPFIRFYAGSPLVSSDGHPLGTLCVIDQKPRTATAEELQVLSDLSALAADELELRLTVKSLQAAEARLAELAVTDELTSLPNRRAFRRRLGEYVLEAGRGRKFGVVSIDIDHFKRVNDTLGHPAGDAVLVKVANTLRSSIRKTDFVARYGGEEFAVILSDVDEPAAVALADKLRKAIEDMPAIARVTASLGVAYCPGDRAADADRLLATADDALYRAKRAGRNQVVLGKA
ncbi:MAG TPA: sensor domain-containing diguanylate cyclase [Polyangiaceae bacterium]|nr:sensor domain-containing diguanylate cyclase [Polyangiaceae bacterium]